MTSAVAENIVPVPEVVLATGRSSVATSVGFRLMWQSPGEASHGTSGLRPVTEPVVMLSDTGAQVIVPLDVNADCEVEQIRAAVEKAVTLLDRPETVTVDVAGMPSILDVSTVASGVVGGVLDGSH